MLNLQLDKDLFHEFITSEIDKRMSKSEPLPYMMDTLKACEYLSVSRPTLLTLVKKSDVPTYSVGAKKLYKRSDIEKVANDLCERAKEKNYDLLEG